jgi:hypothetical protein
MTETEERELRELSQDLSNAMHSLWEPRCIARAFASQIAGEVVLTMQGWIDLEAIRSPILLGQELVDSMQIAVAGAAFGLAIDERLSSKEAALIVESMKEAVREAFGMSLSMRPPQGGETDEQDGFGNWLPVFAFLVSECGMAPSNAMRLPVKQALPLLSATRRNQGWKEGGLPYAARKEEHNE